MTTSVVSGRLLLGRHTIRKADFDNAGHFMPFILLIQLRAFHQLRAHRLGSSLEHGSVSVLPGATAVTRTLAPASFAATRVRADNAVFGRRSRRYTLAALEAFDYTPALTHRGGFGFEAVR